MAEILLIVCAMSCCSSSSSAAAFFSGLIPRTGPHFRKVSGVDDLTKQKPFIVDYYQKSADKKTDKEKQLVVDEIRNLTQMELQHFVLLLILLDLVEHVLPMTIMIKY